MREIFLHSGLGPLFRGILISGLRIQFSLNSLETLPFMHFFTKFSFGRNFQHVSSDSPLERRRPEDGGSRGKRPKSLPLKPRESRLFAVVVRSPSPKFAIARPRTTTTTGAHIDFLARCCPCEKVQNSLLTRAKFRPNGPPPAAKRLKLCRF